MIKAKELEVDLEEFSASMDQQGVCIVFVPGKEMTFAQNEQELINHLQSNLS